MSTRHNAKPQTAELLLRTIIAVNQLNVHRAVATWCNSQSPPQPAEPQVKEEAVREVPRHLATRLTKQKSEQSSLRRGKYVMKNLRNFQQPCSCPKCVKTPDAQERSPKEDSL